MAVTGRRLVRGGILVRNLGVVLIGIPVYALVGFMFMYPTDTGGTALSFPTVESLVDHWREMLGLPTASTGFTPYPSHGRLSYLLDLLRQSVFAVTAALLVAPSFPRRRFHWPALGFAALFCAFVYPIFGSWKWGGGWLDDMGFYDLFGGMMIYGAAGLGALAVALVRIPREQPYETRPDENVLRGFAAGLLAIGLILCYTITFFFAGYWDGSMAAGSTASAEELSQWWRLHALLHAGFLSAGGAAAFLLALIFARRHLVAAFASGVFANIAITSAGLFVMHPATIVFGVVGGVVAFGALFACKKATLHDPVLAISGFGAGAICGMLMVDEFLVQLAGIAASFFWYGLMVGAWALLVRQVVWRKRHLPPS